MAKKILVTGGTGYIGSHTAVELINEGYEVFIVDNLCNSTLSVLDGIERITGIRPHFDKFDLSDKKLTDQYFDQHHDLDAVIHFAALKAVGESVTLPLAYYRNNIGSLVNIMDNMLRHKILHMVFSSSCTVYGQLAKLPVNEDAPVLPAESPYGNTKQISEEIIQDVIATRQDFFAIALRYFNPIGAHPSAEIGELPIGIPNNLVPYITQTAAGLRNVLNVFGDDYDTPDGTCIRDYIYVVDLAKAHVAAIKKILNDKDNENFQVYNVGTGQGHSVMEVIKSFEKVSGLKLNYTITGRRQGDIEKVWADTSLANRELKWKAGADLDSCMLTAWNWEKKYRGFAR
jgi:UDP-glucose 4-epimerase